MTHDASHALSIHTHTHKSTNLPESASVLTRKAKIHYHNDIGSAHTNTFTPTHVYMCVRNMSVIIEHSVSYFIICNFSCVLFSPLQSKLQYKQMDFGHDKYKSAFMHIEGELNFNVFVCVRLFFLSLSLPHIKYMNVFIRSCSRVRLSVCVCVRTHDSFIQFAEMLANRCFTNKSTKL